MGATIRMTKDRRILIRNTAEVHSPYQMSKSELTKRSLKQKLELKKDFLNYLMILYNLLGQALFQEQEIVLKSLKKIDDNIFVAGCYNGSGIGVGTLFGEQIAIKASNENTKEIETIEARNKPTWLPPDPILSLGVRARLIYERFIASSEI